MYIYIYTYRELRREAAAAGAGRLVLAVERNPLLKKEIPYSLERDPLL